MGVAESLDKQTLWAIGVFFADLELNEEVHRYTPVRMDEILGLSLKICSTTSFMGLTPSYVGHNQLPDKLVCQLSVIIALSNNSGTEPLLAYS